MVKAALLVVLLVVFSLSASDTKQERVLQKVRTILEAKTYKTNEAFIKIIFSPSDRFFIKDRIDSLKVVETLKKNGLLDLFFDKPTKIFLTFKTSGYPLFFVKIISDTLRKIGYYRFVTDSSRYNNTEFIWRISIVSEYATDPMILQKELQKKGCKIVDISRGSPFEWNYFIDMQHAHLDVPVLRSGYEKRLKRSLYPHWFDVSKIEKVRIISRGRNRWYPDISFYDATLHLLGTKEYERRIYDVTLNIPKNAQYIKISDIYTMKNIKDGLILRPSGYR